MNNDQIDIAEQFEKHLNSPKQTWLLGAGSSFESNIPLMNPLTDRVFEIANETNFQNAPNADQIIEFIKGDIEESAHIETFLTHLSDLISLAERSRTNIVSIGKHTATKIQLTAVHIGILEIIADVIRWGYKNATDDSPVRIGTKEKSIIDIEPQREFIRALFFSNRAGLEKFRDAIEFFTTNYDTLIEDGLALNQIEYCDGFTGGAVGFWNRKPDTSKRAIVTKLHGSIDWFRSGKSPRPLLRVRDGNSYHAGENGAVMIYPQAAKYSHAQESPFSTLFERFRRRLSNGTDNVLLISGYSFGDDHINADIEQAMAFEGSQLTIIAFSSEDEKGLPRKLEEWRRGRSFKNRIYVASPKGLYRGNSEPCFPQPDGSGREWWAFSGMTKLFSEGLPKDIQEAIQ